MARTDHEFRKLHEWIDEPRKYLGPNHRIERHSYHKGYKDFIKKNFGGNKAVVEWLFHIALDNLVTANKYALQAYEKPFKSVKVKFQGKNILFCEFDSR